MTGPAQASAEAETPLRIDARRNRERIIAAAQQAFAARGLDVPMDDIARRAGVGVATLYRRFPTRSDLIAGAFEAKMTAYAEAVERALAEPDPWIGFCGYVERICSMQAEDRGFTHVLTMTFPRAKDFEAVRNSSHAGLVQLLDRAKAAGALRPDFVPEDIVMVLMANAGVVGATGDAAPDAWRRLVAYLLQAFAATRADPLTQPLPPAPTPAQMYRALLRVRTPVRP